VINIISKRTRRYFEDPIKQARSPRPQVEEACTKRHKEMKIRVHWSIVTKRVLETQWR
jgi:hypothetical protein